MYFHVAKTLGITHKIHLEDSDVKIHNLLSFMIISRLYYTTA